MNTTKRISALQIAALLIALGSAAGCCCPGGPAIPTASLRARTELPLEGAALLAASADARR